MRVVFCSDTVINTGWKWPGVVPANVPTKPSSGPSVSNRSKEPKVDETFRNIYWES